MDCAPVDYVFVALLALFVLLSGAATYEISSLNKQVELRHPAEYARMGQPKCGADSASDSFSVLRLIWTAQYQRLADARIDKSVRILRCLSLASAMALVGCVAVVFNSAHPEATIFMQCFLGTR